MLISSLLRIRSYRLVSYRFLIGSILLRSPFAPHQVISFLLYSLSFLFCPFPLCIMSVQLSSFPFYSFSLLVLSHPFRFLSFRVRSIPFRVFSVLFCLRSIPYQIHSTPFPLGSFLLISFSNHITSILVPSTLFPFQSYRTSSFSHLVFFPHFILNSNLFESLPFFSFSLRVLSDLFPFESILIFSVSSRIPSCCVMSVPLLILSCLVRFGLILV